MKVKNGDDLMTCDTITFQLGTHYLSRVALRVENILLTIQQASQEHHPVIHHAALNHLFDIIKLTEKPELKSRFLKEFMRIEHRLTQSSPTDSVPNALFSELFFQVQTLNQLAGQFGEGIHYDPFLHAIGLTSKRPTSEGELYPPQLLYWLEGASAPRQNDLLSWLKQLDSLYQAVNIYLSLLRNTATYQPITPNHGFYQCPLPHNNKTSCQLILVRIPKESHVIPKMQISQHGLSIRLCDTKSMREIHDQDTPLELSICEL